MATDFIASGDPVVALPPELYPDVDHLVTEDDGPWIMSSRKSSSGSSPNRSTCHGRDQPKAARLWPWQTWVFFTQYDVRYSARRLLSLDVILPADVWPKSARSYFIWEYGKPPDVVIEIVSNREGGEDKEKIVTYAQIGIGHYAIYDPEQWLNEEVLRVYRLKGHSFERMAKPFWFSDVGLGLGLWDGRYEDLDATWLRWVDSQGVPVPNGRESTEAERRRADAERQRAEAERQRAEAERRAADRLSEQLRQLGVQPPS